MTRHAVSLLEGSELLPRQLGRPGSRGANRFLGESGVAIGEDGQPGGREGFRSYPPKIHLLEKLTQCGLLLCFVLFLTFSLSLEI